MRTNDPVRQLGDSAELLFMLERLIQGLSARPKDEVPWAGIQLTLRHAREIVLEAQDACLIEYDNQTTRQSLPNDTGKGTTLADRVLQLPRSSDGSVRDLLDRSFSGSSQRKSDDEFIANSRK
jgi:hypothetical protein